MWYDKRFSGFMAMLSIVLIYLSYKLNLGVIPFFSSQIMFIYSLEYLSKP